MPKPISEEMCLYILSKAVHACHNLQPSGVNDKE